MGGGGRVLICAVIQDGQLAVDNKAKGHTIFGALVQKNYKTKHRQKLMKMT